MIQASPSVDTHPPTRLQHTKYIEKQLRALCLDHVPRESRRPPDHTTIQSIAARMWQARRLAQQCRGCILPAIFRSWQGGCRYSTLHRQIKQANRQNKRNGLAQFLEENVDIAMTHRAFDWHRCIRQLSPKQPFRKIQIYDDKGHPLPPGLELQQIVQYFTDLFTDPDFVPMPRPALQVPFTIDNLIVGLNRLPMTKALAPDGLPAIVW